MTGKRSRHHWKNQRLTGMMPREAYVDRGYRGHGIVLDGLTMWIAGSKTGGTIDVKKKLKRRNAVEPVIGHMKAEGRLGRNFLKGALGDAMKALCRAQPAQDSAPAGAFVRPNPGTHAT